MLEYFPLAVATFNIGMMLWHVGGLYSMWQENYYYDMWWGEIEIKLTYPVVMDVEKIRLAAIRFTEYEQSKKKRYRKAFMDFMKEVNGTQRPWVYATHTHYGKVRVTEEGAKLIELCQSPYYMALLKMYWMNRYN